MVDILDIKNTDDEAELSRITDAFDTGCSDDFVEAIEGDVLVSLEVTERVVVVVIRDGPVKMSLFVSYCFEIDTFDWYFVEERESRVSLIEALRAKEVYG